MKMIQQKHKFLCTVYRWFFTSFLLVPSKEYTWSALIRYSCLYSNLWDHVGTKLFKKKQKTQWYRNWFVKKTAQSLFVIFWGFYNTLSWWIYWLISQIYFQFNMSLFTHEQWKNTWLVGLLYIGGYLKSYPCSHKGIITGHYNHGENAGTLGMGAP